MAFARLAFRILLVLLILLVLIGLLLPSRTSVERSVLIQAPPEQVFPHVNGMRAFHAWSPWVDAGGDTIYEFSGPEQGVGSRLQWQSRDAQAGFGSQEIIASRPPHEVEMRLVFGDKGGGDARLRLVPEGSGTRVAWRFDTDFGWDLFGRYVGLMLDGMIGSAYERGLQGLKQRVEQAAAN